MWYLVVNYDKEHKLWPKVHLYGLKALECAPVQDLKCQTTVADWLYIIGQLSIRSKWLAWLINSIMTQGYVWPWLE